jgi:hypothetical protein
VGSKNTTTVALFGLRLLWVTKVPGTNPLNAKLGSVAGGVWLLWACRLCIAKKAKIKQKIMLKDERITSAIKNSGI